MRQPKQRMAGQKLKQNLLGPMTMQEKDGFLNMASSQMRRSPEVDNPQMLMEQSNLHNMQGSYKTRYY